MAFARWQPGLAIQSPIYVDANILVSFFIRRDKRFQLTSQLFGELFASGAELALSALTVAESLWGLAKGSHHEIYNQPSGAHWGNAIYQRRHTEIFAQHGRRMKSSIHDWIADSRSAGIKIDLVPLDGLERIAEAAPTYMETFRLASADAVHLATAEQVAESFITSDTQFEHAAASPIQIYLVR